MNNPLITPSKLEHDALDQLSSPDNSPHNFDGDNSPLQARNSDDGDNLSVSSKKIRKKRNAYQKIDDNIRVKLLEAVQQGETLKSAAKRFNINYSSAKSILHTFRKEGRILKKSGQDKFFGGEDLPQYEMGMTNEHIHHTNVLAQNPFLAQKIINTNEPGKIDLISAPRIDFGNIPVSPSNGLTESFGNLLKLGSGNMRMEEHARMGQHPSQSIFAKFSPRFSPSVMSQGAMNHQANVLGINMSPVNTASLSSQMLQGNPMDKLKYYNMNSSSSPFSGGGRVMNESTDSSKHSSSRPSRHEFDTFSDMVSAIQNQPRQTEDVFAPQAIRMNTAQILQERMEANRMNGQMEWEGTIENAAMDTFKSFMDAQILLHDALKKANYLNNLVQLQKSKADGSPMFGQLQGFKNN